MSSSLLTLPYAHEIEKRRFAEVQSGAVVQVVQLADRTRAAYFTALAARESAHYLLEVEAAAETGAELARRMRAAGNWNRLDQAREEGFYLDAASGLTRAQLAETVARENLTQLLGLSGDRAAVPTRRAPARLAAACRRAAACGTGSAAEPHRSQDDAHTDRSCSLEISISPKRPASSTCSMRARRACVRASAQSPTSPAMK